MVLFEPLCRSVYLAKNVGKKLYQRTILARVFFSFFENLSISAFSNGFLPKKGMAITGLGAASSVKRRGFERLEGSGRGGFINTIEVNFE